ncbi:PHD and RING finger domain-containing protein 1-like isoform X1 [Acipenser oxyrinchus oxyrinchus]|uniref:PHD and RING finger domain-containing protein 1-like isoform X1 n=1 Tax=Acipenser oxyrinchus oxyrinchus TaxID=40147 RepID=A0AAD8D104_ACIOX|nr:PHD and RING finger domain-containing protein 1-like isoform X1 [Acipenser oxyrinchus oxyrinchus]
MDDEDSQDELINKNAYLGKGKRQSAAILSDEDELSDEDGDELEEGDTESEEEEEDGDGDDTDDEDEDEEEEYSDDAEEDEIEGAEKELEGAVGGTEARFVGLSSDEDAENCPICLNTFQEQALGTPESCAHYFCLDCILEWSKNANSCPVDRIIYTNICMRSCFGGKILKKIPVQNHAAANELAEEDNTQCEVCGRSDREDRLLLCDGCDAGYHMECLNPPLNAVPVEEWFCPECAVQNASHGAAVAVEEVSEEEVAALVADAVPTTSRLRTNTGRTRAIARTRQSERVRATVNRNRIRITQAQTAQHVPRYLMESSMLDDTINSVVAGLNTAVYIRPLTPRAGTTRKRRRAKRRKTTKPQWKTTKTGTAKSTTGKGTKRRKRRIKRRRSKKERQVRKDTTARSRIAKNLGIGKPLHGLSIPSVYRQVDASLGGMRSDIGAAPLSVYGNPFQLDSFDDSAPTEKPASSLSPVEVKRKGLSQSALRSHQPVARPISIGLSRGGLSIPEAEAVAEAAPVPDLLGSILSGQSMLLMDSSDVLINRDGSLKAKNPVVTSLTTSLKRSGSRDGETSIEINSGHSSLSGTSAFRGETEMLDLNVNSRPPTSSLFGSFGAPGSHALPSTPKPSSQPERLFSSSPTTSVTVSIRPKTSVTPRPNMSHSIADSRGTALKTGGNSIENASARQAMSTVQSSSKNTNGNSELHSKSSTGVVRRNPLKPVWLDVSELPRIPKIKRENAGDSQPSGSRNNGIPDSCMNRLMGNGDGDKTADQGSLRGDRSKSETSERQRHGAGGSTATNYSGHARSVSYSSQGSTGSSTVSFRINTSGNLWHCRRLANTGAFSNPLKSADDSHQNSSKEKRHLFPSHSEKKEKNIKNEMYDPFDPTGSDSSSSGSISDIFQSPSSESETASCSVQDSVSQEQELQTASLLASRHHDNAEKLQVKDMDLEGGSDLEEQDVLPCTDASMSSGDGVKKEHVCLGSSNDPLPGGGKSDTSDKANSTDEEIFSKMSSKVHQKEAHSHSRSSSTSSTRSEKKFKNRKKPACQELKSSATSRLGSQSAHSKKQSCKSGDRRTSKDCSRSSSSEATKKALTKGKSKEKKAKRSRSRSRDRRRSRSRSASSSSEVSERWKKRRRSRSKERRHSRSSSPKRAEKKKPKREISYERYNSKGMGSILKDRKQRRSRSRSRSRERKIGRSRSQSPPKSKEQGRSRSKERMQRSRSRSIEKKCADSGDLSQSVKGKGEKSLQKASKSSASSSTKKVVTSSIVVVKDEPGIPKSAPQIMESCIKDSVALESKVKSELVWSEEAILSENQVSSKINVDIVCAHTVTKDKTSELKIGNVTQEAFQKPESFGKVKIEEIKLEGDVFNTLDFIKSNERKEPKLTNSSVSSEERELKVKQEAVKPESEPSAVIAGSKSKDLVKRVTWNLQEVDQSSSSKTAKILLYKMQRRSKEGTWKAPDHSQTLNQDSSQTMPLASTVPPDSPSCAPIRLSHVSSVAGQTFSPELNVQAGVLELGLKTPTGKEEAKISKSRHAVDKAKNEEYMKKLHMQERAVEEVKLAIKPFYQKRDITKEEYKDILRKAVQKVCHSKSGEINPVKVSNLVKAYVDKYKQARKHNEESVGSSYRTETNHEALDS